MDTKKMSVPRVLTDLKQAPEISDAKKGVANMLRRGLHGIKNWVLEDGRDGPAGPGLKCGRLTVPALPALIVIASATSPSRPGEPGPPGMPQAFLLAFLVAVGLLCWFSARERKLGREEPWKTASDGKKSTVVAPGEESADASENPQVNKVSLVKDDVPTPANRNETGENNPTIPVAAPVGGHPTLPETPESGPDLRQNLLGGGGHRVSTRPDMDRNAGNIAMGTEGKGGHLRPFDPPFPQVAGAFEGGQTEVMQPPLVGDDSATLDLSGHADEFVIFDEPTVPTESSQVNAGFSASGAQPPEGPEEVGTEEVGTEPLGPWPVTDEPVRDDWFKIDEDEAKALLEEGQEGDGEASAKPDAPAIETAPEGAVEGPEKASQPSSAGVVQDSPEGEIPVQVLMYSWAKVNGDEAAKEKARQDLAEWAKGAVARGEVTQVQLEKMTGVSRKTLRRWIGAAEPDEIDLIDPWEGPESDG